MELDVTPFAKFVSRSIHHPVSAIIIGAHNKRKPCLSLWALVYD
jgi:hypothetical protein